MRPKMAYVLSLLFLSGCASTQLNYNTLDLAASINALSTKQIVRNLATTLDDDYAIPSQAVIAAGTVTTSNGFNPTFSIPLNTSSVVTSGIMAAATMTTSNSTQTTHPNTGLSLAITDGWQQGWTLDPVTDPDELRRLRALYRYATGKFSSDETPRHDQFVCEYAIQTLAQPVQVGDNPSVQFSRSCSGEPNGQREDVYPDPIFFHRPGCVLCKGPSRDPIINGNLKYGFVTRSPSDGFVLLAVYNSTPIYVCGDVAKCKVDGRQAFNDFVLFVAEATGTSSSSTGSSKSPTTKALGAPVLIAP